MLLLIDIFSINKGRGYVNPSLEIIVRECCSTGGCPLEEACEHFFLNQSAFLLLFRISFLCIVKIMLDILLLFSISSILFMFCIFYISGILQTSSSSCCSLIGCTSCCLSSTKVGLSKRWCSYWCISHTWVYGFHNDTDMDGSVSFCSRL
jgi:hypothetical protein